ncbi:hypothetical protein [Actinomadura algeriensis]|uniref:Uncharacterized protein n=1 Tax=Actinomadura algeriensis TaxID=1679523 RepID=A0ABR9JI53_9ACTN|nr:hypothetical protein [Actinomadura algeriensis]MBE1530231.1 hypothetical protein [Actinomadura algeriensis]
MTWWAVIVLLLVWAWQAEEVQLWALPLLAWGYYELGAVPTLCGVETTRGHPCKNPARGRLMACTAQPSHAGYKTDALLRLVGVRRPPRPIAASASRSDNAPSPGDQSSGEATVESKQTLMIALTLIATVAGVVQTILTAAG